MPDNLKQVVFVIKAPFFVIIINVNIDNRFTVKPLYHPRILKLLFIIIPILVEIIVNCIFIVPKLNSFLRLIFIIGGSYYISFRFTCLSDGIETVILISVCMQTGIYIYRSQYVRLVHQLFLGNFH